MTSEVFLTITRHTNHTSPEASIWLQELLNSTKTTAQLHFYRFDFESPKSGELDLGVIPFLSRRSNMKIWLNLHRPCNRSFLVHLKEACDFEIFGMDPRCPDLPSSSSSSWSLLCCVNYWRLSTSTTPRPAQDVEDVGEQVTPLHWDYQDKKNQWIWDPDIQLCPNFL